MRFVSDAASGQVQNTASMQNPRSATAVDWAGMIRVKKLFTAEHAETAEILAD